MKRLSGMKCTCAVLFVVVSLLECSAGESAEKKMYALELKPCLTERYYLSRQKQWSAIAGEPKQEPDTQIRIVRYWVERTTRREPGKWLSCRSASYALSPQEMGTDGNKRSYVVSNRNRYPAERSGTIPPSLFAVPLPAEPVEVGSTWEERSNLGRVFGERPEEYVVIWSCRLAGRERYRGKEYARIDYTSTLKLKGKGDPIISGSSEGYALFDPSAGLFVKRSETTNSVWKRLLRPGGRLKATTTTVESETALLLQKSYGKQAEKREEDE